MKVGDKVKVKLDAEIARVEKSKKANKDILKLWKIINGKEGTVVEIISDAEIWVCGSANKVERMFSKDTLEII